MFGMDSFCMDNRAWRFFGFFVSLPAMTKGYPGAGLFKGSRGWINNKL